MEVRCQLHILTTLSLEKEPLLPIGKEAEWAPEQVWMQWLREKHPILAPAKGHIQSNFVKCYINFCRGSEG
jgi:hypothetical protein